MHGAMPVTEPTKTISAVKKRPSGYQQRRSRRGGENVLWKRITATFDADLARFAMNPAIVAPLTRLVFFKHLTHEQGRAGRRYADVMRGFERYHLASGQRTPKSAALEPARGVEDQEIERHINRGTLTEYEEEARSAKRQYKRVMKVLEKFADPVTGRNIAKDVLDDLCLADKEPPAEYRKSLGVVLTALAKEFGLSDKPKDR